MIISTGRSRRDTRWRSQEVDWPWLCQHLGSFRRTAETMREYRAMSKDDQSRVKDVGGFVGGRLSGPRRTNLNVVCRSLVTLDADSAYEGLWDDVTCLYEDRMLCYSTHSHTAAAPRLRFVIPLDREVTPDEYQAIARKLAERIGIDCMDPTTYEPARLMYWPSCPCDAEPVFHVQDGPVVCADDVLREYGSGDAWQDSRLWPIGAQEHEVRQRETRTAGAPEEKPGIIGLFCRAYDIPLAIETFLPDVYEEAGEGRYTYSRGSTAAGAVMYNDGSFLYSNHATDPASGQLCNAFDLVRIHLFGELDEGQENQDVQRRPSHKKMSELAAGDENVKRQVWEEANATAEKALGDLAGVSDDVSGDDARGAEDGVVDNAEDMAWVQQLEVNQKTGATLDTIRNIRLILENDPRLRGCLMYNEFSQRPVKLKPVPWLPGVKIRDPRNGDTWGDGDDAGLREFLEHVWHISSRQKTEDAVELSSMKNAFHPVRDYLDALEWDGTERLDTMLVDYMAADDNEYIRAVTRKWMCGAVARIYRPGCQFDAMLVLTGEQGQGKSRLAQILSRGWFTDSVSKMECRRESYEMLDGVWLAEIAELAAAKKAENEQIKNFVTKREDRYRKAYGRRQGVYPRQCVFYGTTNDIEFLRDRTGGRRFWPVQVRGIERGTLLGLTDDVVDQLWAEAKHRWMVEHEALWLDDPHLYELALEQQARFTVADEFAGLIEEYLGTPLPENWYSMSVDDRRDFFSGASMIDRSTCTLRRDIVCIMEIRTEMQGEVVTRTGGNSQVSRQIANVMNTMPGWVNTGKAKRVAGYGKQKIYCRTVAEERV